MNLVLPFIVECFYNNQLITIYFILNQRKKDEISLILSEVVRIQELYWISLYCMINILAAFQILQYSQWHLYAKLSVHLAKSKFYNFRSLKHFDELGFSEPITRLTTFELMT
jgi:hypothetical protein